MQKPRHSQASAVVSSSLARHVDRDGGVARVGRNPVVPEALTVESIQAHKIGLAPPAESWMSGRAGRVIGLLPGSHKMGIPQCPTDFRSVLRPDLDETNGHNVLLANVLRL